MRARPIVDPPLQTQEGAQGALVPANGVDDELHPLPATWAPPLGRRVPLPSEPSHGCDSSAALLAEKEAPHWRRRPRGERQATRGPTTRVRARRGSSRLFDNLLSSQPLVFNLFGELCPDRVASVSPQECVAMSSSSPQAEHQVASLQGLRYV
jgi:hypothetical protein